MLGIILVDRGGSVVFFNNLGIPALGTAYFKMGILSIWLLGHLIRICMIVGWLHMISGIIWVVLGELGFISVGILALLWLFFSFDFC